MTAGGAVPIRNDLALPDQGHLLAALDALAAESDPVRRCLAGVDSGQFRHPDGRTDRFDGVALTRHQLALVMHLSGRCPTPLTIETGFGLGTSASIIMGTRDQRREAFEHIAFDPWGLPSNSGAVVESYLMERFGPRFRLLRVRSEIGLGQLIGERGTALVGLAHIDGCHHFENVMTDFVLADLLCAVGGFIVMHDANYAAIQTAIRYIDGNRPDYAIAHLAVPNMTVLQIRGNDKAEWDAFTPFAVPGRRDWTPVD